MVEEPISNIAEYSVSELAHALKRTVEDTYSYVRLRGEISGFKGAHTSGHVYFALKDAGAKIDAVIWKGVYSRVKFKPEEGLEVIATGKLSTFPGSSKYQIIIEQMEPSGAGALMALLEERRKKFIKEGLFDKARKKSLPRFPRVIGVVTSPTGAVIRDILHRITDRFPVHVIVWPVRVQGETSAEEIAQAINGFNALDGSTLPRPDVLIVARGGGSLEDLWSFNEEIVVRAAAQSHIPLISAVGHETDTTLIDFAADVRAPTPTAAAEMAVPVRQDLFLQVRQKEDRLFLGVKKLLTLANQHLVSLARALPKLETILASPRQRLDYAVENLGRGLLVLLNKKRLQLSKPVRGLSLPLLSQRVQRAGERLQAFSIQMLRAYSVSSTMRQEKIRYVTQLLSTLSYKNVLARGFTVVRGIDGSILQTAEQANSKTLLNIEFADGALQVAPQKSKTTTSQSDLFGDKK